MPTPQLRSSIPSDSALKNDLRAPMRYLHRGTSIRQLRVVSLFALDVFALYVAWWIAEASSNPWGSFWTINNPISLLPIIGIELGVLVAGGFYRAGEPRRNYLGLIRALTIAEILLLLVAYFYQPSALISRSRLLLFWITSLPLVLIGRYITDQVLRQARQKGFACYSVLLISEPEELKRVVKLVEHEERYKIVATLDHNALNSEHRHHTFSLIQELGIAEVFISWKSIKDQLFLCWHFQSAGVALNVIPIGLEFLFQGSKFWSMGNFPALSFSPPKMTNGDFLIKRIFDISVASFLLILLSPVYVAIALWIRLDSPGPIFYRQVRIGLNNQPFKLWKFRTMVVNADQLQKKLESQNEMKDGILFKLKDDPRVTRCGKFLRQYSLDELPQLINVLLGEMSLVGPRPLPVRDVEKFTSRHFIRQEILPGITGLWQVSGRSDIESFEEVIQLDLAYIQNWCLWLDLSILFKTVSVVLKKTGAY